VESLALSLGISIVTLKNRRVDVPVQVFYIFCFNFLLLTSINLAFTAESRLGNLGKDGIVLSRNTGNVASQSLQGSIRGGGTIDRDSIASSSIHRGRGIPRGSIACSSMKNVRRFEPSLLN